MKRVASIHEGHSQYDDRLWSIAQRLAAHEMVDEEFNGLDYFELLPYFIRAGASVEVDRSSPDLPQYIVTVPDEHVEAFYSALERLV